MNNEYNPKMAILGNKAETALTVGTDIDLSVLVAAPLLLDVLYAGEGNPLGTSYALNVNDQCYIQQVGIFSNFADGLVIETQVEMLLALYEPTWTGATDDRLNIILPALNTWIDVDSFLALVPGSTRGNLYLRSTAGTFNTGVIDTGFNGETVRFNFMVRVAHSYGLEV